MSHQPDSTPDNTPSHQDQNPGLGSRTVSAISQLPALLRRHERGLANTGVYLLAVLGGYISYQSVYSLAVKHSFPTDQARIVAALADLGVMVYSVKALHATRDGRSAWILRLFVTALSLASISMNLRGAWPHPTDLGLHALAPALWISSHEFMLHGMRKAIKAENKRKKQIERDKLIAQGLLPARVAKLDLAQIINAPWSMFLIKRVMWLSRCTVVQAAHILIRRAETKAATKTKTKRDGTTVQVAPKIPLAWTLIIEHTEPTTTTTIERPPLPVPVNTQLPSLPPGSSLITGKKALPALQKLPHQITLPITSLSITQPAPSKTSPGRPTTPAPNPRLGTLDSALGKLPTALQNLLLSEIPPKPIDGWNKDAAIKHALRAEDFCHQNGEACSGRLLAQLLDVSEAYVSKIIKKGMNDLRDISKVTAP